MPGRRVGEQEEAAKRWVAVNWSQSVLVWIEVSGVVVVLSAVICTTYSTGWLYQQEVEGRSNTHRPEQKRTLHEKAFTRSGEQIESALCCAESSRAHSRGEANPQAALCQAPAIPPLVFSPSLVMPSTLKIQHLCFLLADRPAPPTGIEVVVVAGITAVATAIFKPKAGQAGSGCDAAFWWRGLHELQQTMPQLAGQLVMGVLRLSVQRPAFSKGVMEYGSCVEDVTPGEKKTAYHFLYCPLQTK